MRTPSINPDLSLYLFRFVSFWNEYASARGVLLRGILHLSFQHNSKVRSVA